MRQRLVVWLAAAVAYAVALVGHCLVVELVDWRALRFVTAIVVVKLSIVLESRDGTGSESYVCH